MGEREELFVPGFNGSLHIEARPERLTGEAGAVLLREMLERLGIITFLAARLEDSRDPDKVTHPLSELLRTYLVLLALGWRDQDDADALRDDPALRLAVSDRRGVGPLESRPREQGVVPPRNPEVPDGLASQPTLSRLARELSSAGNRAVLRASLLAVAARRHVTTRGGHRPRYLTIDIDSLPIEVEGHQPGSEHNGHYHARIYHPLVATVGETGDLLDVKLRNGSVHTADGVLDFVLPLLDAAEATLCQVASVRIDAGFPDERLLGPLETRRTGYVARVRNNAVLDRMAEPFLRRPVGRRPREPREWFYENTYQAESWSRERRVVLVVQERPDELYLHHFWLITNWTPEQMPGEALLEQYRVRGTAEGHMGELMDVLAPALSSSPRPKTHYRGESPKRTTRSCDSFAVNEVILLLNALAYNLLNAARVLFEIATKEGCSIRRVRERVLRVAGRIVTHGRRAVLIVNTVAASLWRVLWRRIENFHLAET